jgi:hypothetical protein
MNSAEITRARPELALQAETTRTKKAAPAVAEIPESDPGNGDVSDETKSGLFRLAEFIKLEKTKSKARDPKRQRAIQAYDSMMNFNNSMSSGQVLNVTR